MGYFDTERGTYVMPPEEAASAASFEDAAACGLDFLGATDEELRANPIESIDIEAAIATRDALRELIRGTHGYKGEQD